MLIDKRIEKLAHNLVNYSCQVKPGDKVLIEATGVDYQLVGQLIKEIYAVGAFPFYNVDDNKIKRQLLLGTSEEHLKKMAEYAAVRMKEMNAYIGIRGGENSNELCDVPADKLNMYSLFYSHPVHHELRVKRTNWVVLRYPTQGMAQMSDMSTEAFEDFYFDVCNLDYGKMAKAMDGLVDLLNRSDRVHILGNGTDLTFSVKGIGAVKCSGEKNIPDGEVYTAPVRDSVNGVIRYNAPSIENGFRYENVELTFENGKIVKATANNTEGANKIFDTDEGARYVGEFAFGVNPYINKPMGDILFDEKISGSIHFTPGACYDDAYNGNESAVHWDLVLIQTPEYGGGEIWIDDVLVRKDGRFVLPELEALNPENLK
ncbi:MAG: aminopeptidase [Christensenellales bacterium]